MVSGIIFEGDMVAASLANLAASPTSSCEQLGWVQSYTYKSIAWIASRFVACVAICSLPALCSHVLSIVAVNYDLVQPLICQRAFLQCNTPTSRAERPMISPPQLHTSKPPVCLIYIPANKENNFMASASADRSMLSPHLSLQLFVT